MTNFEGRGIRQVDETGQKDPQVEKALKQFRESVHAWGEEEFHRPRVAAQKRSGFSLVRMPILNWAAAGVVALAAVTIPSAQLYEHMQKQKHEDSFRMQQRAQAELAAKQKAYSIDDEELLSHVDTDIAQDTPDAMEPLASLMSDSAKR